MPQPHVGRLTNNVSADEGQVYVHTVCDIFISDRQLQSSVTLQVTWTRVNLNCELLNSTSCDTTHIQRSLGEQASNGGPLEADVCPAASVNLK